MVLKLSRNLRSHAEAHLPPDTLIMGLPVRVMEMSLTCLRGTKGLPDGLDALDVARRHCIAGEATQFCMAAMSMCAIELILQQVEMLLAGET